MIVIGSADVLRRGLFDCGAFGVRVTRKSDSYFPKVCYEAIALLSCTSEGCTLIVIRYFYEIKLSLNL